jgi:hypothetical protein
VVRRRKLLLGELSVAQVPWNDSERIKGLEKITMK